MNNSKKNSKDQCCHDERHLAEDFFVRSQKSHEILSFLYFPNNKKKMSRTKMHILLEYTKAF